MARALIGVSNKEGNLLKVRKLGYEIISTGGTIIPKG